MPDAHALASSAPDLTTSDWLEQAGVLTLFGTAAALQFSIAVAQSLLAISILCWLGIVVSKREHVAVPRFFWPLLVYSGATLVSAAFCAEPRVSFADTKQLVLFLMVPLAYRFMAGRRASTLVTLVV